VAQYGTLITHAYPCIERHNIWVHPAFSYQFVTFKGELELRNTQEAERQDRLGPQVVLFKGDLNLEVVRIFG